MNALPEALQALYPFKSRFFDTGRGQLHYLDEGQGPVVLMLHGNPTWSFMYRRFVSALRRRYRCIVPDHMGCGLSERPTHYPYTLAQHIGNIEKLLDHLKVEHFHLIGHDWGGAIGMGVAGRRSEQVKCIQLMNTAAFRDARIAKRIAVCRWPFIGALLVQGLDVFAGGATCLAVKKPLSTDIRAGYRHPYRTWQSRKAVHAFIKDIPMKPEHPSAPTLLEIEQHFAYLQDKPMQLLWGMRDFCFNPHFLKRWQTHFPKAKTVEFSDAGHYVFEDEADACVEHVFHFLNACPN